MTTVRYFRHAFIHRCTTFMYLQYSHPEWIHIYTDGSLMKNNSIAGAGIYCKLFSSYLSLGTNSTHFDGELEAINSALKQLFHPLV